jgi:spore coat protein CotF
MEQCQFNEQDKATDLLQSEKYLAGCYNSYLLEAATPEVKQCLSGLLSDTHSMQQRLFEDMNSRGWYPVTKAEEQKIMSAKQKFSAKVSK